AGVPGLEVVHSSSVPPAMLYRLGPDFGREPAWWQDEFQRKVHNARVLVTVLSERDSWEPRTVLAVDALTRGRASDALALARAATAVNPLDTLGWVVQGEALRTQGHHREAVASYERALALDANDETARAGRDRAL